MLLEGRVAVVYGGGGHVGGAVARTFAAEGARVFLAGRTGAKVDAVATDIVVAGGRAEAAELDTLDVAAVERHLDAVVDAAGRVDVSMNATGFPDHQGTPLREMAVADAVETVRTGFTTHLVTATAAARQMERQGSGVILTLSTSACGLSGRDRRHHRTGAFGVACAAVEELTRSLAGELGPLGIRVVCLRPDALPESWGAAADGEAADVVAYMTGGTMMDRMPTLREVADAAAFAASDRASAMTGAVINLTCGSIPG